MCKILLTDYGILPITMTVLDLFPALCMACFDRNNVQNLVYSKYHKLTIIAVSGLLASYAHRLALSMAHLSTVHAVKAVQPIFSALLCTVFFADVLTADLLVNLFGIVVGVVLATYNTSARNERDPSELARVPGIFAAIVSTFFLAITGVLNRRIALKKNITQSCLYSASRLICIPIAVPIWSVFSDASIPSKINDSRTAFGLTLAVYLATTIGQHLVSLATLVRMSAVGHAVVGSLKRVFVIVVAVFFFGNRISSINALGFLISAYAAWRFSVPVHQSKNLEPEEVKLMSYLAYLLVSLSRITCGIQTLEYFGSPV